MIQLQKKESGFSVIESIMVLFAVILIAVAGWFVYKNNHMAGQSSTSPDTNQNPGNTSKTVGSSTDPHAINYAACLETKGHVDSQLGYNYGSVENEQSGTLKVCNTPSDMYIANTNNLNIAPVQMIGQLAFSALSDKNLKKVILSTSEFINAGCEQKGSIPNNDIIFGPYIASNFAVASPTGCSGQGGLGSILYVYANGKWLLAYDLYLTGKPIRCSTISQYHIPTLFVLEAEGSTCYTSSDGLQDLVSGLVTY